MPTKTVFITGSSRGLGLAFAKYYTKAGWNVIATTRKDSNTQHLKALSPFKMLTVDVQDESTVLAAAKQLKDIPINLLINNAGICTDGETMTLTSKENMMKEFEVHAVGPLLVTRALLPNLRLAAKGTRNCVHVVQLSTIYASIESGGGPIAYCTSKTALHMVNRSMANELEHDNIAVILLDPGMIYTNMLLSSYEREATKVVAEMANVIEDTTIEDAGKFMDYDGTVLPWIYYKRREMASGKRPLAAALALQVAEEEEEEEEEEEGQQHNRKRQKIESSDDGSEEEKETSPVKTTTNPPADHPVNVKAKMPDVPLADKYRGGEFFFVRECYVEYYSKVEALLVEDDEECVTITGTPGIGKSIFYAFFLDRFRKNHPDWTIIASTYKKNHKIKKLVVFEPTQSTRYDSPMEAGEALVTARRYGHEKVLWLCDGPPEVEHGQTVVFTSSNEWLRVARNDHQTYYLPPWTLEELQLAASVLVYSFSDDEIENRYWNFGGVARNFFKLDPVNIKIAIHGLTEQIEAITDPRKLENLLLGKPIRNTHDGLLLYNPKGDGRLYETAIVSDMVREKLSERLFSITKSKLDKVYALLKGIPPAASLRGWSFANYAHSKLQEAKRFSARSLVQSDRNHVFKMQPSDEIDVFHGNAFAPELLNNGPYHKHQQKNFESIDGFFFPKLLVGEAPTMDANDNRILLFHMAVSKDNPVRASGIIYLLKRLGLLDLVKANPKRAALVFVRPTDGSKGFKKQQILSGDTPPKEIRDLKGIGLGTVNILAKYFNVVSTADLEAKVDDFEAGRIVLTDKKHSAAWARAVEIWKREVQYLQDQSNIKMVEEIPQYVYPLN